MDQRNRCKGRVFQTACLACLLLSGCVQSSPQPDSRKDQEKASLSFQQKQILRDLDLPEDIQQLDVLQQNAIITIDEMIDYLKQNHDDSFDYVSFSDGTYGTDVELQVRSEELGEIVTVRKNSDGDYEDDYELSESSPRWRTS